MKLAVIFLNKTEFLEEILSAFLEIGVSGATIFDTTGMGHIISKNIPIFAGLLDSFAGSSPGNKMILLVIEEKMADRIAEVLNDICMNIDEVRSYFMAVLPIEKLYGFHRQDP